ncbi:HNH endonuclease [Roseobacter ponti]|uniref:HNH endonuclease n=1 Tax=Roseobacter ponti TaxID=1891787 RepID=A0A858STH2_9RHOB|nr:HNH endonuclease signature motif containing protein [Roseobacter ponti]QJF51092.1 HNH endonuclease [Roseobacter ponti]
MTIHDISFDAIIAACDEYDELGKTQFLRKYGFRTAKTYMLFWNGKFYDSKAILGAAHGYISPNSLPLKSAEFSGGLAETVSVLESLGFEVVSDPPPSSNPNWTEAEVALAIQFYRGHAPKIPGKSSDELISLANEIRTAARMQGLRGNEKFRNADGVYMHLMHFQQLDPNYSGSAIGKSTALEEKIWSYSDKELNRAAEAVRTRISAFEKTGQVEQRIPEPNSAVLKLLIASSDPVESQLGHTLHLWQEAKRNQGKRASLGREPGQIKNSDAVSVIEQRVRSSASGFDEVTSTNESYEKIVIDHPDRFANDVIAIAKARLAEFDLATPTDDREELEAKIKEIILRPYMISEPPAGNPTPRREVSAGFVYVRDPRVVAYTRVRANGICELCAQPAPFKRPDGSHYLETHHVVPLAENGPDTPQNCAGVCPNCHRALHSAENKDHLAKTLMKKLASI